MADNENTTPQGTPLVPTDDPVWGTDANMPHIEEPGIFNEALEEMPRIGITEPPAEEQTEEEQEEVEEQEDIQVADVASVVEVEDPGEFKPSDYAFDVTVYDKEGKNGRSVKISNPEDWDKLLNDDPNFGSAAALLKAQSAATRMQIDGERDKAEYDRQKAAYDKAVEEEQGRQGSLDNMVNEMLYLEERGLISKVPSKFRNDWTSKDAKKDPAIKEQQSLLNFMTKDNNMRQKAGLPAETSLLSAYRAWKLEQSEEEESETTKRAGELRKTAGAKVSGPSAPFNVNAPKGIAVGRAGSLEDLSANSW